MANNYGVDTSVLVRLMTEQPPESFKFCVETLKSLADQGDVVLVSNQVIGEAFVAAQHFYGQSTDDAREALHRVFMSGLLEPINGDSVLLALQTRGGAGLFDRLIVNGYAKDNMTTLTLDRRMAALPGARLL